ncbi:YfdX family protein [Thermovibrio sp.]
MRQLLTAALLTLFLSGTSLAAQERAVSKPVEKKVEQLKSQRSSLSFQTALRALSYTDRVIALLHEGKKEEALKLLKEAETSINAFLKEHPTLQLLPVEQQIVVMEFPGTVKDAEVAIKRAKEFLNEGRVQDARLVLSGLADEIDVITTYLPVAMYSQVIKLAESYLKEGKVDEALRTLALVRGSLIVQEVPIPIPFLKAQQFVSQAISLAKKDKKAAVKLLEEARKELEIAKVLGYAYDYKAVYARLENEIKEAEKLIKEGKESTKLLNKINREISGLSKKVQSERSKK